MIEMIKGTYGRVVNGVVEPMTKHSGPFSLSKAREAELVAAGVAVKVEEPVQEKPAKKAKSRKTATAEGVEAKADEADAGEGAPGEL